MKRVPVPLAIRVRIGALPCQTFIVQIPQERTRKFSIVNPVLVDRGCFCPAVRLFNGVKVIANLNEKFLLRLICSDAIGGYSLQKFAIGTCDFRVWGNVTGVFRVIVLGDQALNDGYAQERGLEPVLASDVDVRVVERWSEAFRRLSHGTRTPNSRSNYIATG